MLEINISMFDKVSHGIRSLRAKGALVTQIVTATRPRLAVAAFW
jgi:hypothetical protein